MKDRVPKYPGRVKLTPVSGQENTYDMVRADSPTQEGTPLSKANLLSDATATALGLTGDPTVDEALEAIAKKASINSFVVEKITTSCNWTAPKAIGQKFKVYAVGGGGGGVAYSDSGRASGGGGGGYVEIQELTISEGTVVPIVCGAGGVGKIGYGTSECIGGEGGTTTFGNYLSAPGGKGGSAIYYSNAYKGGSGGDGGAGGGGATSTNVKTDGGNGGTYGGGGGSGGRYNGAKGGNGGMYGGGGGSLLSEDPSTHDFGLGGQYGGDGGYTTHPAKAGTQIHGQSVMQTLFHTLPSSGAAGNGLLYPSSQNKYQCHGGGGGYGGNGGSILPDMTGKYCDCGGGGGGGYGGNGGNAFAVNSQIPSGGGGGGNYGGDGGDGKYYCGGGGGGLFCNGSSAHYEYAGQSMYVSGAGGGISPGSPSRGGIGDNGGDGGCYIAYVKEV